MAEGDGVVHAEATQDLGAGTAPGLGNGDGAGVGRPDGPVPRLDQLDPVKLRHPVIGCGRSPPGRAVAEGTDPAGQVEWFAAYTVALREVGEVGENLRAQRYATGPGLCQSCQDKFQLQQPNMQHETMV